MLKFQILLILLILPMFVIAAFANTSSIIIITTADNDLSAPGCVETEVGCYTPNTTTVEVGSVVIMTNADEAGIHTFTSGTVDGFAATADGTFDSGILQFGDSYEWIADVEGEIPYYSMLNVWMQGMIIVVDTLEHTNIEITATTNKPEYYREEIVYVTGTISEYIEEDGHGLTFLVTSPDDNITSIGQAVINSDGTFDIEIATDNILMDLDGFYTIQLRYSENLSELTFELLSDNITIQSDKSTYYNNEIISINGTITDIDWSGDTTVTYIVSTLRNYDYETRDGGILQDDGTFNFTIDTASSLWGESDTISVRVYIQDYTESTYFYYSNTPSMEPEALYEMMMIYDSRMTEYDITIDEYDTVIDEYDAVMDEYNATIDEYTTLLDEYNVTVIQQQLEIETLHDELHTQQSFIDTMWSFLGLDNTPAPIIISFTYEDADNNSLYTLNDKIIITFDSITTYANPRALDYDAINGLFTFSDSLGADYTGNWTWPDTFEISIKDTTNATLTPNTTVTPAGIIPILSADDTSEPSYMTSPALSGDFVIISRP